jgi:Asp-tRNA(Asn)/Glu-tRNA(Gln) amidotransferase A subunit family amidase
VGVRVPFCIVLTPVGLMVIGEHGEDRCMLAAAAGIEAALTIAE